MMRPERAGARAHLAGGRISPDAAEDARIESGFAKCVREVGQDRQLRHAFVRHDQRPLHTHEGEMRTDLLPGAGPESDRGGK